MSWVRSWPTKTGWALLLLSFLLVDLGALGNNLVLALGCIGFATLAVDLWMGRANLRGIDVHWRLPAELFAEQGCRGAFVVDNRGTPSASLLLNDGFASAHVSQVDGETDVRAFWRFAERGRFRMRTIDVRSRFPFGCFEHYRTIEREAAGVVYPRPLPGSVRAAGEMAGATSVDERRADTGDFRELRGYRPGDRLRSIHWRTSARVGEPMVVVRGGETTQAVRIVVENGPGLETSLRRATGAVLDATRRGLAVGLVLPGHPDLERPRSGPRWRREMLDRLALYEVDP